MEPNPQSADEQLAQTVWVRRLAQNILRDPGLAEDAAQEGSIAAWRKGPSDSHAYASWLATTVRRLAGRLVRGEARRSARERTVARPEALPSTAELVERAEAHRALVAAVLALDEPYRSTVLLRYVEDLPPRAIARRAGVPVATVKTRLARGLERLRKQLEGEHRDAREWLALLVPFTRSIPAPALVLGSTLVKSFKIGIAALLVLLVATGLFFALRPRADSALANLPAAPEASSRALAAATVEAGTLESGRVGALPPSSLSGPEANAAPPEHERLTGRVLDLAEKPIAGARIQVLHSPSDGFELMDGALEEPARELVATVSDEEGRFGLEVPYGMLVELRVSAAGFGPERLTTKFGGGELVIHLGASSVLTGLVSRTGDGSPVVGATVRVSAGTEDAVEHLLRTDALGRYRCEGLAPGRVHLIVAPDQDLMTRWEELELAPGQTLEHDLQVGAGELVRGRVLDERTGAAIAGAEVSAWDFVYKTVRTDVHGAFELGGLPARQRTLSARAPGYGRVDLRVLDTAAEVELRLLPGRRATGRVLASSGRPIEGAFVAATASAASEFLERNDVRTAVSGADGRFELADLRADLPHVLFVRASGWGVTFRAFPPGEAQATSLELGDLVLESAAGLEGRVLDASGAPRAGVSVALSPCPADPAARAAATLHGRRSVESDATGRYVLRDLAPGDWSLALHAPALPPRVEQSLRLSAGQFLRGHDLCIVEDLSLEGWISDEQGHPLEDAWITAIPEDGSRAAGTFASDAEGHFEIGGLAPGSYTLRAQGPRTDSETCSRFEELSQPHVAAGTHGLALRLFARSSSIRGRVLDAEGEGLAGAFVWRSDAGFPPEEFVLSDGQGRFELPVTTAGTLQLAAQRGIPLPQSTRTQTYAEGRVGRVVDDDEGSRALSDPLRPGSAGVDLRLRPRR